MTGGASFDDELPPRVELGTLSRASIASFVATLVDAGAYQGLLAGGTIGYGGAAALAALVGAVVSFSLGRFWAFPGARARAVVPQATRYAVVSLLTNLALQAGLGLLVDRLQGDARLAWIPAKGLAWLLVSYPLQRRVVFSGGHT